MAASGAALQDRLQGFRFGHDDSELFLRYSNRAVLAIEYMNLDFRREAWTRDKDFGVTISSGQNSYVEALTASTQNYDCIPK